MKTNYGITIALLVALMATSCKTSEKMSSSQGSDESRPNTVKQNSRELTADEWDGTWIIKTAEKKAVTGEELVQITFNTKSGEIYANDGCNYINGIAIFGEDNNLHFESLISTLKSCDSGVTDQAVQRAFNTTHSYTLIEGKELAVKFCDKKGNNVMTLVKRMVDQLNGSWTITTINGKKVTDENLPSLVIDIPENRLTGFAGCNRMFGNIVLNDTPYGISFEQIATTRMACPDMTTERDLVEALNQVKGFYLIDDTHAALYQQPDKPIIVLEKTK